MLGSGGGVAVKDEEITPVGPPWPGRASQDTNEARDSKKLAPRDLLTVILGPERENPLGRTDVRSVEKNGLVGGIRARGAAGYLDTPGLRLERGG